MSKAGKEEILRVLRGQTYAVQASVNRTNRPQAAVVGFAVSDALEIVFDTTSESRKADNLRRAPRIAFVVWDGELTIQYEGVVDEPTGEELARVKSVYFARFPDGRDREGWSNIAYFRAKPTWMRLSDFSAPNGPRTVELTLDDL